jgi:hypothetical protein
LFRHAGIDESSTRMIACEEADWNTTAQIRESFTGTCSPWLLVPPVHSASQGSSKNGLSQLNHATKIASIPWKSTMTMSFNLRLQCSSPHYRIQTCCGDQLNAQKAAPCGNLRPAGWVGHLYAIRERAESLSSVYCTYKILINLLLSPHSSSSRFAPSCCPSPAAAPS